MREIKFRAWDTKNKEMVDDPPALDDYGGLNDVIECLMKFEIECYEEGPFILMQYTGLKDKNGTEIYEGDIIEYNYSHKGTYINCSTSENKKFTGLVEWNRGRFESGMCEIGDKGWKIEIVGNIYEDKNENPNLL